MSAAFSFFILGLLSAARREGTMTNLDIYQQVVRNSLEVTGSRIVVFARYDPEAAQAETIAWAGHPSGAVQHALAWVRLVLPGWDPLQIRHSVRANPLVERLYLRGEPVAAPVREIVRATVDPRVAAAGETILGITYAFLCPLTAEGQVLGSLGFYTVNELTDRERGICQAFAREASLTLQNLRLVERERERVRELEQARRRVGLAEERQRREIAELLHSRVQSNLLLVWDKLRRARDSLTADPERARALITEAQDQLDAIRERDIRQAAYLLHPSIIRVGLAAALRSLTGRFSGTLEVRMAIDAQVGIWDDPLDNRLPEEFRVAVYRIVEEALTNVQRHARATCVELDLRAEADDWLRLSVQDNGRGFVAAALQPGLGLSAIADRVAQLAGVWSIESQPGAGTRLIARLPLPQAPAPSPG